MSKHQMRSEQTMRKVKDAGFKLFVEKGYASTSIDEIMKEAGYTKGAFYAHFDSKEDFFLEVLDERIEWQFDRMQSIFQKEGGDVIRDIQEMARLFIDDGKNELYTPMILEFLVNTNRIPEAREKMARLFEDWRQFLTEYLQHLKDKGAIRYDMDSRQLASSLIALFNGFFMQHHADPRIDPHEMMEAIMRLLNPANDGSVS